MKSQDISQSWIKKIAGILDPVQDTLAPDLFDAEQKLRPHIRKAIIERASQLDGSEKIRGLVMLGSLTGYQYNDTSDIDINIMIEDLDDSKEKTKGAKKINGKLAPGTNREINFFLSEWTEGALEAWKGADFGTYDVMNQEWLTPPGNRDDIQQPEIRFRHELREARALSRQFDRMADSLEQAKKELGNLIEKRTDPADLFTWQAIQRKKRQISELYKDLYEFVAAIDKDRKIGYSSG